MRWFESSHPSHFSSVLRDDSAHQPTDSGGTHILSLNNSLRPGTTKPEKGKTRMANNLMVFAGNANPALADKIAKHIDSSGRSDR